MKKIICILVTVMLTISIYQITASAEDISEIQDGDVVVLPDTEEVQIEYLSDNSQQTRAITYQYVGTVRYWGLVRYYDHSVYKNTSTWCAMLGLNLTDAIFHSKDTGSKSLSFTKSKTYFSETANSFSTNLGGEAGVADMIKASVNFGVGRSNTVGRSYQKSSTIQAEIPKSASTGYYKLHVCHNFYKTKIVSCRTDGTHEDTRYIWMPFGESYAAVLYSTSTESGTWKKWT